MQREEDTMDETHTETPPPAAPKRKYRRRRTNRVARGPRIVPPVAAGREAGELEGLSREECCFDCGIEKCVISGKPVCIHPYKGGIKADMQGDPVIVRRYQQARKELARQEAEKKR